MTTAVEFCKSFPWSKSIEWFDLTGIHKIVPMRRAKIELTCLGTSGEYRGFTVSIINIDRGVIDEKIFRFDDYLDKRSDDRRDYPISGNPVFMVKPKLLGSADWRWYIAEPATTKPICEAIEQYINYYSYNPDRER